jgi:methionyl-tRNA formyltransferase
MMGTGTFAEPTFQALLAGPHTVVGLVTQPDRPVGQERGSTRQVGRSLKAIAEERQIPVFQPESINTPEGVAKLKEFAPELLVVAAYGQILSKDVLTVSTHGGINVHGSLLPKYRGAAPVAWAIYHGETQTGVTIIKMSVHLDAGDILAQKAFEIDTDETAGELEARLGVLGSQLAIRVIEQIATGTAQGVKQDKSLVTKAPKLTKEHGLIDWHRHARDICNHVRAMQPWPTAYTFWHRQGQPPLRLLITRAAWKDQTSAGTWEPGQIKFIIALDSSYHLHIAAGHGTQVDILELQPAGKRRMSAGEFLHGRKPQAGDYLGPAAAQG